MSRRLTAQVGYEPQFRWQYLKPAFWGIWLAIFALMALAFVPFRWRDKFAAFIGRVAAKKAVKPARRADINLSRCFPDWHEEKRQAVIRSMFETLAQVMLGIGEIALRSPRHLQKRAEFLGIEHIRQAKAEGKNVILLVPHSWAIDASGIILHTYGLPMTSMYNPHRNPLIDWLWNATRERFGGKMHARQNGIKPFLADVRKGELGYFLPDEDYGEALSVFVNFFATEKATLPGLSKMAKVANAVVIPMFPCYDANAGRYRIEVLAPLEFTGEPTQSARAMNEVIEYFVTKNPEQYAWILQLLRTQRDGSDIYD